MDFSEAGDNGAACGGKGWQWRRLMLELVLELGAVLGTECPPSSLPDTTTTTKTPTALHRRVSSALARAPPIQGNKESDKRGCHPIRDGILARQWLELGSIHGFSHKVKVATTNDKRAPTEKLLLSSGAVRRETPNEQNEHKSAGPGAAQAQHGPWHQRVPDCKRQLQTVLNPGRPIRLRQHRLACAFVHLCP